MSRSLLDPGQIIQTAFDDSTGGFSVQQLGGSLVPEEFDELSLSYVTSGFGIGELDQVVYKLNSVTIATLQFSYNASDQLIGVVRS